MDGTLEISGGKYPAYFKFGLNLVSVLNNAIIF